MKRILVLPAFLIALTLASMSAEAHCDAIDGPVATTAIRAIDTGNVNLILPYAPVEAEAELRSVFEQVLAARSEGPMAKELADRYFMETAVRLHRAGEGAAYTGLQPAGKDFGPAIPAAETALETGKTDELIDLMVKHVTDGIIEKFKAAEAHRTVMKEPVSLDDVPAARERVSAEFAFIGYVEGIYLGTKKEGHLEGESMPDHE